ncbi:MAG: CRTAC1 family protein [Acidobacteria bacterium]|nr:CRTAC1 family protein [Acidobacteriota bacterium]
MRLRHAIPLVVLLATASESPVFVDVTARWRVVFRHQASKTWRKYLIESTTGGVAMLDYDNDGRLDLYFVNGAELKDPMRAGAQPEKTNPGYWNRLFRNRGDGTFEDVTEQAGVKGAGYGMGVATGDYDNDGDTDLYVTAYPRNTLYRNNGDGTFTNVTEQAGVAGGGWSTSAAFVDIDHDGLLDLVVVRYVNWDFEPDIWCGARTPNLRSYCHPDQFQPIHHLVYRNKGGGEFEDVTARSGFLKAPGKGLGIAIHDFDRDGRIDIAVANDSVPQQLFHNLGGGVFREMGFDAGIAYDDDGNTYGGMGIDFEDYDNDGWPDLVINALASQRYAMYRNRKGSFEYISAQTGVGPATWLNSGWGMKFFDYDNDGWKDLVVAQGHVMDNIHLTQPRISYLEPLKLLRNIKGKFFDVSAQAGPPFQKPLAARGAAVGDLDNDGLLDIAVACLDGAPVVIRNAGGNANHWIGLHLIGTASNRDGIGARIRLVTAGGLEQHRIVSAASSYLAANDKRAHFGLGADARVKLIEIQWPSGRTQTLEDVSADRYLRVKEP